MWYKLICFYIYVYSFVCSGSAYIVSSSGDVVVDIGSSVTHSVIASGIPDTITYEWRKDGSIIPGQTSNTLTINNTGFNDIGVYECIPSNTQGTFNTSTIQLDIKGKLTIQSYSLYSYCVFLQFLVLSSVY